MRKIILLFFLISSCQKKLDNFAIPFNCDLTVDFKESTIDEGKMFYLGKYLLDNSIIIIDSCKKSNNKLFFKTAVKEPFKGCVFIKADNFYKMGASSPVIMMTKDPLLLEWNDWNEKTKKHMKVYGGENNFLTSYNFKFIYPFKKQIEVDREVSKFGSLSSKNRNYKFWYNYEQDFLNWTKINSNKYYTVLKLFDNRNNLSDKTFSKCLEILRTNFKGTSVYTALVKYLDSRKKTQIGSEFLEIKLLDYKQRNLSSKEIFLPNKDFYVIDFGASWCVYCIQQARKINNNYLEFDDAKIQIISISLDTEFDDWLAYNKKENYKWKSYVINNKIDSSSVKSLFNYLPTYIVLDRNKRILGRYNSLDSITLLKKIMNRKNTN